MTDRRRLAALGFAAGLLLVGTSALAQAWPTARPVRIVVSQAAGAAPDILARQLADRLSKGLGQAVFVENRPGAGNIIGAQAVAKAAPDGYTFFLATAAALVTNPLTFKNLPYDPTKDFTTVSLVGRNPFFIVAHPSLGARTVPELVALDKATPGSLSFSSDGPRGFAGMMGEWFNKRSGARLRQIPYVSTTQALGDTVGNTTPLSVQAVGVAEPFVRKGSLRALAVSSSQRLPGFEDVPTIAESYPGFEINGWFALVAPARTAPDIVKRLNAEMNLALGDPAIVGRMRDFGIYTEAPGSPEKADQFVQSERELWSRLTQTIGIEPE